MSTEHLPRVIVVSPVLFPINRLHFSCKILLGLHWTLPLCNSMCCACTSLQRLHQCPFPCNLLFTTPLIIQTLEKVLRPSHSRFSRTVTLLFYSKCLATDWSNSGLHICIWWLPIAMTGIHSLITCLRCWELTIVYFWNSIVIFLVCLLTLADSLFNHNYNSHVI